jgi:AraC-like DNA-binding protein
METRKALEYFLRSLKEYFWLFNDLSDDELKTTFIKEFNQINTVKNSIRLLRSGRGNLKDLSKKSGINSIEFNVSEDASKIRNILIKTKEEILVVSDAKELFDYKIESLYRIINHINTFLEENQKIIKKIFFKYIIIILINAIEIYFERRFLELNKNLDDESLKNLYDEFIPPSLKDSIIKRIETVSLKKGISKLEIFLNKNFISFQKWEDIKKSFLIAYNIKIEQIISKTYEEIIINFIDLRQKLIHSNFQFSDNINIDFLNTGVKVFNTFIENFHKNENLKNNKISINKNYFEKIGQKIKINSRSIFDDNIKDIKLIEDYIKDLYNSDKIDYHFKTLIYKQLIVMLVSSFEIYVRNRFLELGKLYRKNKKKVHIHDLLDRFISGKESYKRFIIEKSKEDDVSILKFLIDLRKINFQNWDHFKRAFKRAFGIVIGDIYPKSHILDILQNYLKWRKKIIHFKIDSPVLNFENSPPEKPIYLDDEIIETGIKHFNDFISKFHDYTLTLCSDL